MPAPGSKAQLVRVITEYHARLMYKGALSMKDRAPGSS
jgi:hypothetical protein